MTNYDAHTNEYRGGFIGYIYDEYKSVHGIRPRWMDFDSMSTTELERRADDLEAEVKESIAHDNRVAADLDRRIAAATADPRGIVWNAAEEWEQEYGVNDTQAYIPTPIPTNSAMADAFRGVM